MSAGGEDRIGDSDHRGSASEEEDDYGAHPSIHSHISKNSLNKSLASIEEASCETWTTRDPATTFLHEVPKSASTKVDSNSNGTDSFDDGQPVRTVIHT